jgi:hypothetical protein
MVGQVCREGAVIDPQSRTVGLALYVRGAVSGVLVIRFPEEQSASLADPRYRENVEALKAVQPEDLPATEIDVRLGASWLPPELHFYSPTIASRWIARPV